MDFYPRKDGGAERTDWKRVCGRGRPTRASLPSSYAGVTKKKCKLHRRRRRRRRMINGRRRKSISQRTNRTNDREYTRRKMKSPSKVRSGISVNCAKSSAHALRVFAGEILGAYYRGCRQPESDFDETHTRGAPGPKTKFGDPFSAHPARSAGPGASKVAIFRL